MKVSGKYPIKIQIREPVCGNCTYVSGVDKLTGIDAIRVKGEDKLTCHHKSPWIAKDGRGQWPIVQKGDWCGNHKFRE